MTSRRSPVKGTAPGITGSAKRVLPGERETRLFGADLEVRSAGDGRTIHGIAAPFNEVNPINGGPPYGWFETVRPGAFARTISERGQRIKLLIGHNYERNPVGRPVTLREDAAGLYVEYRVSKTPAGDETLELIRDGSLDAFSIGFSIPKDGQKWDRDFEYREILEAKLLEVSVVFAGAYNGAVIEGVRSAGASNRKPTMPLELMRRRLAAYNA